MSSSSRPRYWCHARVSKNGLQVLQRALALSESDQPSPIIVAIDFEQTNNLKNGFLESQDSQLGIATFDTKILSQPLEDGQDLITTENYITGSDTYIEKASNRFVFGESTTIQPAELVHRIDRALPKDRPVILVGHAVNNELDVFHALGYTLAHPNIEVIDTFLVANEVFEPWRCSLGALLRRLRCPVARLHSAGNDANFTLRAALILAVYTYPGQDHPAVGRLRQIALSHSTSTPGELFGPAKKKPRKKRQSKPLSLARQNKIRERRAAWRIEAEKLRLY
ncbi:hypothetical protein Neosp_000055 [[Neocosmospora] mangrovei]